MSGKLKQRRVIFCSFYYSTRFIIFIRITGKNDLDQNRIIFAGQSDDFIFDLVQDLQCHFKVKFGFSNGTPDHDQLVHMTLKDILMSNTIVALSLKPVTYGTFDHL